MWLGHFIEHLMCIGGELEHHKALPRPAKKKQSSALLCSRSGGIYRPSIGPGLWTEPGVKDNIWSRFQPKTGTNCCGPGARHIRPSSCLERGPKGPDEPGPMAHEARPAPWPHESGPKPPWVPVRK